MEACKKNPSNHSFKYKLSFHADKEATYCSWSIVGATAGATWGWGKRAHTQATAPASLFKGESMGLVGELGTGQGQGTCQLDTAGQALSKRLLKSAVTLQESAQLVSVSVRPGEAGPDQTLWEM